MNAAEYVVSKLGGPGALAKAIGKGQSTVAYWQKSGTIPSRWHPVLLELAATRSIDLSASDFIPTPLGQAEEPYPSPAILSSFPHADILGEDHQSRPDQAEDLPRVLCGSADHPMRIPSLGIEIPCYVIEGERRVLVQRGMVDALGMARGTAGGGGDRLSLFVQGERIKPFIDNRLMPVIVNPIKFKAPNSSIAYAYDAEVLHSICLSVLAARRSGKLQKQQEHIAERCELLIAAWSLAGIISAVDEATGFQYLRAKNAIEQVIDKWLVKELQPWKRYFPADYYKHIHLLNDWNYDPNSSKRPGVVGHWTNDIIYDRLGPGLTEQLHEYAGRDEKGRLKHHLTRFLTTAHGIPELKAHFDGILALMRASSNWAQFKEMLNRSYPKPDKTLSMALNDLDQIGKPPTLTVVDRSSSKDAD